MRILGLVVGIILALIVAVWVAVGIVATGGMQRIGDEQWPAGLGTLASVEARVRPQKTTDGARRLIALAAPLGISFKAPAGKPEPIRTAIAEYVQAEHGRAEPAIGEPPAEVLSYLAAHETEIDALRDHLLHGEPIAWELDASKGFAAPLPNLLGHMNAARLLTARALLRGRGNDVRAWDDLHAAFRVAQILEPRPELISQLIVLTLARSVNAAAWKLPHTNAAWLGEMQGLDHRRLLLRAYQYDMWNMWRHGEKTMGDTPLAKLGGTLGKPYVRASIVSMAHHQRATAQELAAMTACGFDGAAFSRRRYESMPKWNIIQRIATPNLDSSWQRVFRTVAEREAASTAMLIENGQPIVATSACSDGVWRYEDGRLTFSRDLPRSNKTETVMPLSLAIPARATRRST